MKDLLWKRSVLNGSVMNVVYEHVCFEKEHTCLILTFFRSVVE